MNNSVGSRTAAAGNVGAAIVTHVACNVRSRTDAVVHNWKGLRTEKESQILLQSPRDQEQSEKKIGKICQ